MNQSYVFVSLPLHPTDTEYTDDVVCENEDQYTKRIEEHKRIVKVFVEYFGFKEEKNSISFGHWMNGDGKLQVKMFSVDENSISLLERRGKELLTLREQAISKLTHEEMEALGIFATEGTHCRECYEKCKNLTRW